MKFNRLVSFEFHFTVESKVKENKLNEKNK